MRRTCPKCKTREMLLVDETDWLCTHWECWDVAPTRPDEVARGVDPLLSETNAFSQSVNAAFNKHVQFISTVAAARQEEPNTTLSVMMNAVVDVTWSIFCQTVARSVSDEEMKRAFVAAMATMANHAVMRGVQQPSARPPLDRSKMN